MIIFILRRIIITLNINQKQSLRLVKHQSETKFKVDHIFTEKYGKQSVSYLGPKIWNSIPQEKEKVALSGSFQN